MGAPTIYKWDDPSAPVLRGNYNGNGLYEVLKACLVNGYGSKPAAGWSFVYDQFIENGNCSFTNATESGVLGLYHSRQSSVQHYEPILYVADAMVSATVPVNGRSRGQAINNTASVSYSYSSGHHGVGAYLDGTQQQRWVVIANENFCWVLFTASTSAHSGFHGNPPVWSTGQWQSVKAIGFGAVNSSNPVIGAGADVAQGNFYIVGGYQGAGLDYGQAFSSGNAFSGNLSPVGSRLASNYFYSKMTPLIFNSGATTSSFDTTIVPVRLYASAGTSINLSDSDFQLGHLPGLCAFLDGCYFTSVAARNRFYPGGVSMSDIVEIDGRNFMVACAGISLVLISLDGADW